MDDNHIAGHLPSARSRRNLDGFAGRVLRSNKSGDAVGRPSCRSSLLGDPGPQFLVETGDSNRTMKNSLNYVSTCLRVVVKLTPSRVAEAVRFLSPLSYERKQAELGFYINQ